MRHSPGSAGLIGPDRQSEEEEEPASVFAVEGAGDDDDESPSEVDGVGVVPVGFVLDELDRESVE